jgi:hypothetical protein
VRDFDLRGALRLNLVKEPVVVTATSEEIRESASLAVKTLLGLHSKDKQQDKRPNRRFSGQKRLGDLEKREETQSVPIRRISHR